jgi:transposase
MKTTTENVARYLKKVSEMNNGALTVCGYEAGPTGFGLCRELQKTRLSRRTNQMH